MKKLKFSERFEKTANFSSNWIQTFLQNLCNCFLTANSLNILRDLTLSVAFYSKFNNPGHFQKFQSFFSEKPFFLKKTNFWKFRENSLFRSHSTSNLLTVSVAVDIKLAKLGCLQKLAKLGCLQKFRFLFRKNHLFLEPKMSRNLTDSFNSAATLLPLSI